VLVKVTNY